jgi:hypothetical protein
LTEALSFEPAVTLTRLPAGIWISAPVCGLRPVRAAVSVCSKAIQPGIETLPPLATVSATVVNSASTTLPTVAWLWPVEAAMAATSSVLFKFAIVRVLLGRCCNVQLTGW